MGSLPRDHRAVVELWDLEGRSVEEVAAKLNRSRGATYMLRARAYRQLAEILGASSQFFGDWA